MKNKLINKFAFMFVIGLSLLFSCSSAEISANQTFNTSGDYNVSGSSYNWSNISTDYTLAEASSFLSDFVNNGNQNSLNLIFDIFKDKGYTSWYYTISSTDTISFFFLKNVDFGVCYSSDNNPEKFLLSYPSNTGGSRYWFSIPSSDTPKFYRANVSGEIGYHLITFSNVRDYYFDTSVKKLTYLTETTDGIISYIWDGESYYEGVGNPDTPDFEGISDIQKVSIINSIINSDDFSIVPQKYRNQFFIIKDKSTKGYNIYFYPEQYFLKGRIFEEGSSSDVSYKAYKIIAFEGSNFLWDLWQSISPFDYYVFSGHFNEDETFISYFKKYKNSHELNQYYFNYEEEPIVYTTRDIGFVIYNIDSNEYVDDIDNSISSTVLTDDNGNEITIEIPVDNSAVSDTPWNRFVALMQSIPAKIKNEISNMTGLTKIVTLISPIGSAILIILNVLLSSISLLARAVAFVYTLPTINASDALFLVDVDSTTGLVFAGNSWGTKFLEGLNMVKEFSWNGLNLWTLFTSFIVAMFAIHCVKLVRKHYHY